jgi:hypothetical protein
MVKARGYYTKNTNTSLKVAPIIKEVVAGNYINIKTLAIDS